MHNLCLLGVEFNPVYCALGNSLVKKGLCSAGRLDKALANIKDCAIIRVPKLELSAANAVD